MTDYTILRSKRKTLSLEITRASEVLVRAPQGLPQEQIDHFVLSHRAWIDTHLAQMQARLAAHPPPSPEHLKLLRRSAKEQIPGRVAYYSERMGLSPSVIRINSAKTRFGSCSAANHLSFSCLLMDYPDEAIDYVVVHELAHIQHKNHSPAFYALIEDYLPDWRTRRQLLR